jgi:hypothetical protein
MCDFQDNLHFPDDRLLAASPPRADCTPGIRSTNNGNSVTTDDEVTNTALVDHGKGFEWRDLGFSGSFIPKEDELHTFELWVATYGASAGTDRFTELQFENYSTGW